MSNYSNPLAFCNGKEKGDSQLLFKMVKCWENNEIERVRIETRNDVEWSHLILITGGLITLAAYTLKVLEKIIRIRISLTLLSSNLRVNRNCLN